MKTFVARIITRHNYSNFGTWMGYDAEDIEVQANSIEEAKAEAQSYTLCQNGVLWVEPKENVVSREA